MGKPIAFSRSGESCPIGKKTVPKHTKIPEETNEIMRKLAAKIHMTDSEFICWVLMCTCHGKEAMRSVNELRLAVVSEMSEE